MRQLRQVKLLPAREQVASILRNAILSREFVEGQEITLEQIATQVGVSNMPVREAFQILASDGLIKLRPNKGAVVMGVNDVTIRDHYETRALLEADTAARCCRPGKDISTIREIFQLSRQAMEANDPSEYSNYNQAFHMEIWNCSGNEKMRSMLSALWSGISMGHKLTQEENVQISFAEHQEILEAIERQDVRQARNVMYAHIIRSMENVLSYYSDKKIDK